MRSLAAFLSNVESWSLASWSAILVMLVFGVIGEPVLGGCFGNDSQDRHHMILNIALATMCQSAEKARRTFTGFTGFKSGLANINLSPNTTDRSRFQIKPGFG